MPMNWDDLFKYDIGFNPQYPKPEQNSNYPVPSQAGGWTPTMGRDRWADMAMPEYNMAPMQRYTQYLTTEPDRANYQPGKFRSVVNGLSAGLEAMESGSLARGFQLGDILRDRPYDDAYRNWNQRGNKLKAEVELENANFKNKSTQYDRAQQRANQESEVRNREKNTELREQELHQRVRQFEQGGWEVKPSGNGKYMATRINPTTQQIETLDTGVSINDLTPQQKIQQDQMLEQGRNQRARESNATSRYGTDMTRKTALDRLATDVAENDKDRSLSKEIAGMPSRSNIGRVNAPNGPADMATAVTYIKNGFPEFNKPELISVRGNSIDGTGLERSNPKKFIEVMRKIAQENGMDERQVVERWQQFKNGAARFAPVER